MLRQQLQFSERAVREQLMSKEAELTRAEETIRRELCVVCVVTRGPPDCRGQS